MAETQDRDVVIMRGGKEIARHKESELKSLPLQVPRTMALLEKIQWMEDLVSACSYKPGWFIEFAQEHHTGRPYIQLSVSADAEASLDSAKRDGTRTPWKSGKRYLSAHMCSQEVVGAVFALIKDAEMHETHEWFRYRGASIYNPHLDPDVLASIASKASSFVTRANAMTMEEGGDA